MHDLLIKNATVIDGSGAPAFHADVAIRNGMIADIGAISDATQQTLNADGAWLTPGFIDIHTHYDGQASWDETFSPSIQHGATTVLLGNCGVGFAPLSDNSTQQQQRLIQLMEGVEDIPGAALAEGVKFNWTNFESYMAALDAMPHTLDFACLVPHDPLRMAVMGERALAGEAATPEDCAAMQAALQSALKAGAAGFSTGRSDNHRTSTGQFTPASEANAMELNALASAFQGLQHGVIQLVNDFDVLRAAPGTGFEDAATQARFTQEFDIVKQIAQASGRPLSMTWLQRDPGGIQWQWLAQAVQASADEGLPMYLQTAARGIGVITGLETTFHPLMGFPLFKEIAHLPLAAQAAALRDPARRERLLQEKSERLAGDGSSVPPLVDMLLARIDMISARMFPLTDTPNYAPTLQDSMLLRAKAQGMAPLLAIYDFLAQGDGKSLLYFPIFNYNDGNLEVVRQMLQHPRALMGLSDAGAHVGTICDASFSSFMLSHWAGQGAALSLPQAVNMLSGRNAAYLGLKDRGFIRKGLRADFNLIDPARLQLHKPHIVHDLPAGGKRLAQSASGYIGTWVAGQCVQQNGNVTPARPGRLLRFA
jgi:N-acyl-D-aspartate/D-glutamate deacylase